MPHDYKGLDYMHQRYEELTQRHSVLVASLYKERVDNYDVVICWSGFGNKFEVIKNEPELHMQDLAILCSEGNMQYGFKSIDNIIIISRR